VYTVYTVYTVYERAGTSTSASPLSLPLVTSRARPLALLRSLAHLRRGQSLQKDEGLVLLGCMHLGLTLIGFELILLMLLTFTAPDAPAAEERCNL